MSTSEEPIRPNIDVSPVVDESKAVNMKAKAEEEVEFQEDGAETGHRRPVRVQDPRMPTREEVLEHELTHLPYRSWCRHCVRGKGKVIDHRRQGQREVKIRELHCDYCFMGNSDE